MIWHRKNSHRKAPTGYHVCWVEFSIVAVLILAALFCLCVFAAVGCKSGRYVPCSHDISYSPGQPSRASATMKFKGGRLPVFKPLEIEGIRI